MSASSQSHASSLVAAPANGRAPHALHTAASNPAAMLTPPEHPVLPIRQQTHVVATPTTTGPALLKTPHKVAMKSPSDSIANGMSASPESACGRESTSNIFAPSSREQDGTVDIEDGSAAGEGRKRVASDWGYNFKLWSMYEQRAGASSGRDRQKYARDVASRSQYTVISYHHTMQRLAQQIRALYPGKVRLLKMEWSNFADGWPNLAFPPEQVHKMQDSLCESTCFLANFEKPEYVFEQLSVIYALPRMRVRNFRVVCPWFSTGTMERVETLGQIATAKTLAKMLDITPNCLTGPTSITIYDIHALQEQFYFSENVLVELKTAVFLLKQEIIRSLLPVVNAPTPQASPLLGATGNHPSAMSSIPSADSLRGGMGSSPTPFARKSQGGMSASGAAHDSYADLMSGLTHNIAIVFPDDGAKKRFAVKFPEFPHVVMEKTRIGEDRIVKIKDGAEFVHGKRTHCVIIDDLVQTGGTLLESMKALVNEGASQISCYVTHGVFPNDSWKKFIDLPFLHRFWVTDTIPNTADKLRAHGKPFEILSIAPLLGHLVTGAPPNINMGDAHH